METARSQLAAAHPSHHAARDTRRDAQMRGAAGPSAGAYTIAHAGRQVRFGPVVFWIAVGTVMIMAGWSITAATYLAFRDDVLRTLIARQAQQQFGYEDRIADLRAQIDRTTSRQLLDQEQFEQKLDELMRRQAALESRANALSNFADPATTGSIGPASKQGRDSAPQPRLGHQSSIGETLDHMEASLDSVEARQANALGALQDRYEIKTRRIRSVLDQLGVKPQATATGGPFVPVRPPPASEGFQRALFRVNLER
ncbi:MAG TPA: M23 family peptidase, partial [Xanthobacteraceae bacterium]|nr:M23 family peptidase [Xanthobacteraceae bacterium]